MEIKVVSEEDIDQVVNVHKASFVDFFLTELGDHFLSVYYNCVRKDKKGILLGFYEEGKLYGFAAATTVSKSFNTHLILENIFQFSLIGIRLLFTKTSALIRLFKNFSKTNASVNDKGEYAELLSIGVSDKKQGQGAGKKLLLELEETLKTKGCSQLSLTTDFYNKEKAIGFYNGLGYEIFYDFIAYPNRKMYRMIKKIN
jgi:ribosomal protein S18 acetylase RimI-like enzyme